MKSTHILQNKFQLPFINVVNGIKKHINDQLMEPLEFGTIKSLKSFFIEEGTILRYGPDNSHYVRTDKNYYVFYNGKELFVDTTNSYETSTPIYNGKPIISKESKEILSNLIDKVTHTYD